MGRRGAAALGEGWHVGIVTVAADETAAVLDVFGLAGGGRFHTGRMAVPGGVTYLVAAPPAGPRVAGALAALRERHDPAVVVLVGGSGAGRTGEVLLAVEDPGNRAQAPVLAAVAAFFAAAGEPATLPGFDGDAPFRVRRGPAAAAVDVRRFAGGTRAWAVVRGVGGGGGGPAARNTAQALRYLVPYLRPRL
jgi:hypothetical protein